MQWFEVPCSEIPQEQLDYQSTLEQVLIQSKIAVTQYQVTCTHDSQHEVNMSQEELWRCV